ncbi:GMC oxidoreductase-domain-containing protein [Mycena vitilis]|nr:GMC oxidoreductase-domain-containing protein [Mycena vitilis]
MSGVRTVGRAGVIVEPYFQRSENFGGRAAEHHGAEGKWKVRDMGEPYFPTARSCVEACAALGLTFSDDINDPTIPLTVCAKLDCIIDEKSRRSSTFSAFLPKDLAEHRKAHLQICTGAAGVIFQPNDSSLLFHVKARREVILCDSGHITPQKPGEQARLPDLELMPIHFNYSEPPIPIDAGAFSLKVALMRPKSRGSVTLASVDPLQRPRCDLAFLTEAEDYAVLRKGIRLAKRIGEKMRELGANLKDLYMPESETEAELDAFIRKTVRTAYHYGCTCRMVPEGEAGVVDGGLKVHGIANLRIADCSIIPEMMSTHLQAPAGANAAK